MVRKAATGGAGKKEHRGLKNPRYSGTKKWKNFKQIMALEAKSLANHPVMFPSYTNIVAAPTLQPKKKYCDLTGLELRYYSKDEYKILLDLQPAQIHSLLELRNAHSVIKIRGADGNWRIQVEQSDDISASETIQTDINSLQLSNQPNGTRPFPKSGKSIGQLGLKHGDMLFAIYTIAPLPIVIDVDNETSSNKPATAALKFIEEHPVDKLLEKEDGLIKRQKDPNFCRHGANDDLQPYDEKYLNENKIKHMSFHAYLRKVNATAKKPESGNYLPPLEEPSFKVKPSCDTGHAPYPKAMCAKCQPSSVVLQQQTFRMVDHVEFETHEMVDSFIGFWRATGLQRFGYLYGRYEPHTVVPLGIKAVVCAIYEPPQKPAVDGVELEFPDNDEANVEKLAKSLGLERVGMIYTDLTDSGQGKVVCKRHKDSFFLSGVECVFIAREQSKHHNKCRYSSTGQFGSKFVTVVISGDVESNIHLSAYQVSNTCMGLVRDGIIDASVDPQVMLVQESTSEHYVPEVFFKFKNKYGVTVQEPAKPTFPVDYFIVTLSEGFPTDPKPLFLSKKSYAIENRLGLAKQDLNTLGKHLKSVPSDRIFDALSDFHALLYMYKTDMFNPKDLQQIVRIIQEKPANASNMLVELDSFQTLLTLINESSSQPQKQATEVSWTCIHCTFINSRGGDCEMCGLPKQ